VGNGDLGWRYGEEVGQWTAVMAWRLGVWT
jgi:hypothetical protein